LPLSSLIRAADLKKMSYVALTGYDFLGVRYAGGQLPAGTIFKTSFTASAVGASSANGFGVEPVAGTPTQVRVDEQDDDADDGNPATDENRGRDFHLQAIC